MSTAVDSGLHVLGLPPGGSRLEGGLASDAPSSHQGVDLVSAFICVDGFHVAKRLRHLPQP